MLPRHRQCGRNWRSATEFFFFQAEDGIRDGTVTGVQTCALPISARPRRSTSVGAALLLSSAVAGCMLGDLISGPKEHGGNGSPPATSMMFAVQPHDARVNAALTPPPRSEERRVGKECRCRWASQQ